MIEDNYELPKRAIVLLKRNRNIHAPTMCFEDFEWLSETIRSAPKKEAPLKGKGIIKRIWLWLANPSLAKFDQLERKNFLKL